MNTLLHSSRHKIEFISVITLLYFFDFMKATEKKDKKKQRITNPVVLNFALQQFQVVLLSTKACPKNVFHVDQNHQNCKLQCGEEYSNIIMTKKSGGSANRVL